MTWILEGRKVDYVMDYVWKIVDYDVDYVRHIPKHGP